MTHGTYSAYTNGGCRCESCTEANREAQRRKNPRVNHGLTREEAGRCQICRVPIREHPLRACWRFA